YSSTVTAGKTATHRGAPHETRQHSAGSPYAVAEHEAAEIKTEKFKKKGRTTRKEEYSADEIQAGAIAFQSQIKRGGPEPAPVHFYDLLMLTGRSPEHGRHISRLCTCPGYKRPGVSRQQRMFQRDRVTVR